MWKILEKRPFFGSDMAGLGKYSMGRYDRIGVYRVNNHLEVCWANSIACFTVSVSHDPYSANSKDIYTGHPNPFKFPAAPYTQMVQVFPNASPPSLSLPMGVSPPATASSVLASLCKVCY